jgi:glucan phosphoethanolaminetransferase (alkaline phosphatase superfamily)
MDIFNTSKNEAMGLIESSVILIAGYVLVLAFYFYIVISKLETVSVFPTLKAKMLFLAVFIWSFLSGYVFYYITEYRIVEDKSQMINHTNFVFMNKFGKIYPYDVFFQLHKVYSINKEIEQYENRLENFRFDAVKINGNRQKEVYVFVIGETGRYKNFSINGYHRETSPLLKKKQNLVSYSDFISEANGTIVSLPLILTRATAVEPNRSMYEKSFVDAFKEAGFSAYWIANQGATYSFIRRITKNTDGQYILTASMGTTANYDECLLPLLDRVLQENNENVLIVIHSSGSHFRYSERYPDTFDVFKPSIGKGWNYASISPQNKKELVNAYDNSILYTDFFLSEIIKKIDSLNCTTGVMYLPDHGENLFDTKDNIIFHARNLSTKYDFHIPFFIWYSDKYNSENREKIENLHLNKDKPLSTNCIFYSILDFADITFPGQNPKKSIFSNTLSLDSIRYVTTPDKKNLIYESLSE